MITNLKSWRKSQNKPFIFRSRRYGSIRLRTFLRVEDFEILEKLIDNESSIPREFTIQVLNQVALHVPVEKLSTWDDKTLLMLASKWANKVLSKEVGNIKINDFDKFKDTISNYVEKIHRSLSEVVKGINTLITNQIAPLVSQVNLAIKEMAQVFSNMELIQSATKPLLSEFSNIFVSIREIVKSERRVREKLKSSEYELAPLIINIHELFSVKGSNFNPTITKKLVDLIRKDEFTKEVELLFNTPRLRKRLSAIKQALNAHKNRQYYLSTPVFIAQSEGIFTDWLILLKLVRREKGEIIVYNENRKLNSLKPKVKYAGENLVTDGLLKTAIDDVLMRTVNKRNAILHGEKSNYGIAKNSTQALLLVLLFAGVLENESTQKKKR